jgi:hypothetical protein
VRKTDNLTTFICWVPWNLGASTSWNPHGLSRPVQGLLCFHASITCVWMPGYFSWYSDSLRAGRSGDWIPVGERFSAQFQTGCKAHPASYTMGTGSYPGVKRSRRGVDHPPPSSIEVKERVDLYLYSHSEPTWLFWGELCLYLYLYTLCILNREHDVRILSISVNFACSLWQAKYNPDQIYCHNCNVFHLILFMKLDNTTE